MVVKWVEIKLILVEGEAEGELANRIILNPILINDEWSSASPSTSIVKLVVLTWCFCYLQDITRNPKV